MALFYQHYTYTYIYIYIYTYIYIYNHDIPITTCLSLVYPDLMDLLMAASTGFAGPAVGQQRV